MGAPAFSISPFPKAGLGLLPTLSRTFGVDLHVVFFERTFQVFSNHLRGMSISFKPSTCENMSKNPEMLHIAFSCRKCMNNTARLQA